MLYGGQTLDNDEDDEDDDDDDDDGNTFMLGHGGRQNSRSNASRAAAASTTVTPSSKEGSRKRPHEDEDSGESNEPTTVTLTVTLSKMKKDYKPAGTVLTGTNTKSEIKVEIDLDSLENLMLIGDKKTTIAKTCTMSAKHFFLSILVPNQESEVQKINNTADASQLEALKSKLLLSNVNLSVGAKIGSSKSTIKHTAFTPTQDTDNDNVTFAVKTSGKMGKKKLESISIEVAVAMHGSGVPMTERVEFNNTLKDAVLVDVFGTSHTPSELDFEDAVQGQDMKVMKNYGYSDCHIQVLEMMQEAKRDASKRVVIKPARDEPTFRSLTTPAKDGDVNRSKSSLLRESTNNSSVSVMAALLGLRKQGAQLLMHKFGDGEGKNSFGRSFFQNSTHNFQAAKVPRDLFGCVAEAFIKHDKVLSPFGKNGEIISFLDENPGTIIELQERSMLIYNLVNKLIFMKC